MNDNNPEALKIFQETKGLLRGHFILRSGLHSEYFVQCAQVCQYLDKVARLAELLLGKIDRSMFQTVVAPAMGGLVIGQEVARQSGARFIFVEKESNGQLALRRGFKLAAGEKVLIVEDVITRGGRAAESIEIVRKAGAIPAALAVLVDRSDGNASFDIPWFSLLKLNYPNYTEEDLPPELAAKPVEKPGS